MRRLLERRARRLRWERFEVLSVMIPGVRLTSRQVASIIDLRPARVTMALHALLEAGVLTDGWHEPADGKPPRRYYVLPAAVGPSSHG